MSSEEEENDDFGELVDRGEMRTVGKLVSKDGFKRWFFSCWSQQFFENIQDRF